MWCLCGHGTGFTLGDVETLQHAEHPETDKQVDPKIPVLGGAEAPVGASFLAQTNHRRGLCDRSMILIMQSTFFREPELVTAAMVSCNGAFAAKCSNSPQYKLEQSHCDSRVHYRYPQV